MQSNHAAETQSKELYSQLQSCSLLETRYIQRSRLFMLCDPMGIPQSTKIHNGRSSINAAYIHQPQQIIIHLPTKGTSKFVCRRHTHSHNTMPASQTYNKDEDAGSNSLMQMSFSQQTEAHIVQRLPRGSHHPAAPCTNTVVHRTKQSSNGQQQQQQSRQPSTGQASNRD
jgi:hypothetical protein